jgi:hypothetical protein
MAKKKKKKRSGGVTSKGDGNVFEGDVIGRDKIEQSVYDLGFEPDEKHGCLLWLERGVVFVFALLVAGAMFGGIGYVIGAAVGGEDLGSVGALIGGVLALGFAIMGASNISRYRS